MMIRVSSSATAGLWRKWQVNNFRAVSLAKRTATSKSNKDLVQKSEFDKKINAMNQKIDKLLSKTKGVNTHSTESTSAVANKVNKKIDGLNKKMGQLLAETKRMEKLQRLELALANSDFQKFEYFEEDDDPIRGYGKDSANLVESIIQCFMFHSGYRLPRGARCKDYVDGEYKWTEEKFRNKIVVQIETLTNYEALLVDNDDGSYTIYHS